VTKTRTRRFVKLTIGAELKTQLVAAIKVRRGPANDARDFPPVVRRAHAIRRIKVGIGDKGYDSEKNHELLRDELHARSIIPARREDVPIWRTRGEVPQGDEARLFEEDLPPEVEGRDDLLRHQEDDGRRGEVDTREGPEQRDADENNLVQRSEDSQSGLFFTQGGFYRAGYR
jgi:Transposase DDE domain